MVLGPSGNVSGCAVTASTNPNPTQTTNEQLFHANPASLNLHVWYLGAHCYNNEGSLQRWQRELLLLKGSQQVPSTPQNGLFSNDGAWNNKWTSGVPL